MTKKTQKKASTRKTPLTPLKAWQKTEQLATRPAGLVPIVAATFTYFNQCFLDDASYQIGLDADVPEKYHIGPPSSLNPKHVPETCEYIEQQAKQFVASQVEDLTDSLNALNALVQAPDSTVPDAGGSPLDLESAIKQVYLRINEFRAMHRLIASRDIPAGGYAKR